MIIRWADRTPSPWRNGGGVTREIAASPAGSGTQDFDWRVSIADVGAAGSFSSFPGVERVITLLEGGSMVLQTQAAEVVLTTHAPHRFAGEERVTCRLPDGPTRNLNLMTRRGRASGDVSVHTADVSELVGGDGGRHLVLALEHGLTAADSWGKTWTLSRYDVLDSTGPGSVGPVSVGVGTFALISLT